MPREEAPLKNSTWLTEPSLSDAVAAKVNEAGAVNTAPLLGLLMVTVGVALLTTLTVMAAEVVDAPWSSVALTVRVYVPALTLFQGKLYGLVVSSPSLLAPSKNSTLATEPSVSLAEAVRVMLAGATKEAASPGLLKLAVGGLLTTMLTLLVALAPRLSVATAERV